MRGLAYYEDPEFHTFLLSRERREFFPIEPIFSQIRWDGIEHLLDFGMGPGYFLPGFYKHLDQNAHIWGAECQEELIDFVLQRKTKEGLERLTPFFNERTEHPLLPDWIPEMDAVFSACTMSTFANPALAIKGVGRSMKNEGRLILIDWEKVDAPTGPDISQKVSRDRMSFFVEDAGYIIQNMLRGGRYFYAMELIKGEEARTTDDRYQYTEFD